MTKGIHENEECIRCGACCIYYAIPNDKDSRNRDPNLDPLFKKSGIPCQYLTYDSQTSQAACTIHEEPRPSACQEFFCGQIKKEQVYEGVKRYANNIQSLMTARDLTKMLKQTSELK